MSTSGRQARTSATTAVRFGRFVVRGNQAEDALSAASAPRCGVREVRLTGTARRGVDIALARMLWHGFERPAAEPARRSTRDRGDPREIATEVQERKDERGRIAEAPQPRDAGRQSLERQARDAASPPRGPSGRQGPPAAAASAAPTGPATAIAISSGCSIIPAGDTESPATAAGMFGHQVDAAVAKAVLLNEVAGQAFTPAVHAVRLPAERQPIAALPAIDS